MAGSETTAHAAMREMALRGHDVTVAADRTPESYEYEGVTVLHVPRNGVHERIREIAKDADVLITHLDCTSLAMTLAIDLNKPLVHFVHNHAQLNYWHVDPNAFGKAALVVFNTHWIKKEQKFKGEPWPGPSIVIHPIVEPEKYKCKPGTKITLCNPTEGKGVHTIYKLAEQMPDYEFLVVEGIYGEQIAPPNLPDEWAAKHPNIEFMKNDPDFRNVLRKTKVLLMPSGYESYGRCAVEAACAGVPSIVHPTQGLWEALGDGREYPADAEYGLDGVAVIAREVFDEQMFTGGMVNGAGIFCLRDDIPSWKAQIERLYSDEVYYRSRSDAALKLANSFDPEGEFDRLEEALLLTSEQWNKRDEVKQMAMWTNNTGEVIYETTDGKLVIGKGGRIPADAKTVAVGRGGEIPEELARANGFLPPLEEKAIEAPQENKAMEAPQQTKQRKTRVKKTA